MSSAPTAFLSPQASAVLELSLFERHHLSETEKLFGIWKRCENTTFSLCYWFLGHLEFSQNGLLELKVIAVYHLNEHASAGSERERGPLRVS